MSEYHFSRTVDLSFDDAVAATTASLARHGFGVLTEIDVTATLKKKLDVDFKPYRILGACSPGHAYKALQAEDKIGTMLPCNVIVQQHPDGTVEVSAIDPVASMQSVENSALGDVAVEVQQKLREAIDDLEAGANAS
ncbi:DUF302 domain-containing protein [Microbaculum marinum]|uniref:DUF302 domain-containing protein n=1 Tax=Microbaculum marinum TaxID=1764581 RepID=A0AAW9S0P2_9HYPH